MERHIWENGSLVKKRIWKFISEDEEKYEGEWKDNKKNGFGFYFSPDRTIYNGEWKDDECNGYGIYTFSNGKKYQENGKIVSVIDLE